MTWSSMTQRPQLLILVLLVVLAGACAPATGPWSTTETTEFAAERSQVMAFIVRHGPRLSPDLAGLRLLVASDTYVVFGNEFVGERTAVTFSATSVGTTTRLAVEGGSRTSAAWVEPVLVALRREFR